MSKRLTFTLSLFYETTAPVDILEISDTVLSVLYAELPELQDQVSSSLADLGLKHVELNLTVR